MNDQSKLNRGNNRKNNNWRNLGIAVVLASPLLYFSGKWCTNYLLESVQIYEAPEEIKGSIITLKKLTEDLFIDYHNMFSANVRYGLEFPKTITLGYTIRYLHSEMEKEAQGEMLHYCIFDNKDNNLVGSIEIRELNPLDPGQFGWWLNENYRGSGRALEALKLIVQAYFKLKPQAKKFTAQVRSWNKSSYHALKKFGFKDAGFYYENGKPARHILEYTRET
jgi:RimJ/RimL family protein N-acetyltransferase